METQGNSDLDSILKEIGEHGNFQIYTIFLMCLPIIYSGMVGISYGLIASDPKYRCEIPECELSMSNSNASIYNPDWLINAIPFNNNDPGEPSQCERFENFNSTGNCNFNQFNRSKILKCNSFIYEKEEKLLINEFNLHCDDQKWKLSLVGTLRSAGHFTNLFFSGYFSDKYGRLTVLVCSVIGAAVMGMIKSFSWNYLSYIVIEFIEAFIGSGIYTAAYILGMEYLKPDYRTLGGAILFSASSIGCVILGLMFMQMPDWQLYLRIVNSIALIFIFYYWFAPESVRWLLVKKQYKRAGIILLNAAKINKSKLSDATIEILKNNPDKIQLLKTENENINQNNNTNEKIEINQSNSNNIFAHRTLVLRFIICSYCWFTVIFVVVGLTLTSVTIGGDKYIAFISVIIIEVPGALFGIFVSPKLGQRKLLCYSFIISGLTLLSTIVSSETYLIRLLQFLIGKFSMSMAYSTIYIYTSEIFPTNLRSTLLSYCSAIGRVGAIIAPQAPLLAMYMKSLPLIMFGGTALLAGILALQFPDTSNSNLPDTIEQAVNIGKDQKDKY